MTSSYEGQYTITGTQEGLRNPQRATLSLVMEHLLHRGFWLQRNGMCKGVDAQACYLWKGFNQEVCGHPPIITDKAVIDLPVDYREEPGDYHVRDRAMVDRSVLTVGCPKGMAEELRSGTWTTLRYSRRLGRPIIIVWPTGRLTFENGANFDVKIDENGRARPVG